MTSIIEGSLVFETGVIYGQLSILDGRITHIETDQDRFVPPTSRLKADRVLAPGFVDMQINGGFGKEFKTDRDAIGWIAGRLPTVGTTSFCATVTTLAHKNYPDHLRGLASNPVGDESATCVGFHLEGPVLNAEKVGAQSADLLVAPEDLDVREVIHPATRIVTLSPELPGGWSLAHALVKDGLRVGIGHSLVSYDETVEKIDRNKMIVVHAFNAMADLNSRKPGLIGAALDESNIYCSIIADKVHVDEATLRIFWRAKADKSKIVAITDGSAVTGLPGGVHQIGTRSIEKRDDRAVLAGTETLVGSILTLNVAAQNLRRVTGCSVAEAIACVSANPARFLGLEDEIGSLRPGLRADLVELDAEFVVHRTVVGGRTVWER